MTTQAGREAWKTIFELLFEGEAHDRMHQAAQSVGLSPGLLKALFHLDPSGGVVMRDLADHWGCDASYITAVVDGLEERGFAARRLLPTDRRVKVVVLTAAGSEAKVQALRVMHEPPSAFGALSAIEQRQLRDLLRKVADADTTPTLTRHVTAS